MVCYVIDKNRQMCKTRTMLFLREYLCDMRNIGALVPSSAFLARAMMENVDFSKAKVIVEYGAGTGSISKVLMRLKKEDTHVFLIEQNPRFCKILSRLFSKVPNAHLIQGDVLNLPSVCECYGIENVEYVISSLPFASLPTSSTQQILSMTKELLNEGIFVTFQYFRTTEVLFRSCFSEVSYKRVWRNIPPAYVLTCKK